MGGSSASTSTTGAVTVLYTECAGNPLWGPNDLVFDAAGGMWFTDHGKIHARSKTHGGVYYAQPDGSSIDEVIYPLDAPNGIGLSPDGSRLYVAETHTGRVFEWGVAGPGRVEKLNPAADHGGNLLFGAGELPAVRLPRGRRGRQRRGRDARPQRGAHGDLARRVAASSRCRCPIRSCTNVCFGGADLTHRVRHAVGHRQARVDPVAASRPRPRVPTEKERSRRAVRGERPGWAIRAGGADSTIEGQSDAPVTGRVSFGRPSGPGGRGRAGVRSEQCRDRCRA